MKWTILSHKLVHFNPRHKRLRFLNYKKKDLSPNREMDLSKDNNAIFSLYERSARHAMETLETSLCSLQDGNVYPYKPTLLDVGIKVEKPQNVLSNIWGAYLEYCRDVAGNENKAELELALSSINGEINLPNSTKFDLLDVMPVLPRWDIMGLFTENALNHPELEKINNLKEPFFMVKNCYKDKNQSLEGNEKSKGILGYPVTIQVGYADLALPTPEFSYTSEKDYFDFCFNPEGPELEQYRVYGALYDAIEKATFAGSQGAGDIFTYTLIYPITTLLGRRHFWHIQLIPDKFVATMEELREAWCSIHNHIQWPLLKNLMSSELEQLDWSYAQSMILKEAKNGGAAPEDLFLTQAMMYVPMKSFTLGGKSQKYKHYEDNGLLLGKKWEPCGPSTNPNGSCFSSCEDGSPCSERALILDNGRNEKIGFVPDLSVWRNNEMPPIVEIRNRHVIEQQLAVTKQLLGYKKEQERKEEAEHKTIEYQFQDWIYTHSDEAQELVSHMETKDLNEITLNCEINGFNNLHDVAKYFYSGLTQDEKKEKLNTLFECGALAALSRLIECHPFKGLTHSQEKYKEEVKIALSCFNAAPYQLALDQIAAAKFEEEELIKSLYNTGKFDRIKPIFVKDVVTKIVEEFTINKELPICKASQQVVSLMGGSIRSQSKDVKAYFATNEKFVLANGSDIGKVKKIRLPVPVKIIFNQDVLDCISGIAGIEKSTKITVTLRGCQDPMEKDIPKLLDYGVEFSWPNNGMHSNVPRSLQQLDLGKLGVRTTFFCGGNVFNSPAWTETQTEQTDDYKIIFDWKYWRITE